VNNLPKVVAQQRRGRALNLDRKSDALPLSHRATHVCSDLDARGKYWGKLSAIYHWKTCMVSMGVGQLRYSVFPRHTACVGRICHKIVSVGDTVDLPKRLNVHVI